MGWILSQGNIYIKDIYIERTKINIHRATYTLSDLYINQYTYRVTYKVTNNQSDIYIENINMRKYECKKDIYTKGIYKG